MATESEQDLPEQQAVEDVTKDAADEDEGLDEELEEMKKKVKVCKFKDCLSWL